MPEQPGGGITTDPLPRYDASKGRWPRKERSSYPAHWVRWFGWRQFVVWVPKVGLRSAVVTIRLLPRHGSVIGVLWFRDDDNEGVVRFGVGLAEIEVQEMTWIR